jgi:transposase
MPAERTAMRQVRDVLRLKMAGVAINEIARRVGVASSTVRLTLKRLAAAGLGWPLPPEMTDTALEQQLFTAVGKKQGHRRLTEPDWAAVHRDLKRKHVTLQVSARPEGRLRRQRGWRRGVASSRAGVRRCAAPDGRRCGRAHRRGSAAD